MDAPAWIEKQRSDKGRSAQETAAALGSALGKFDLETVPTHETDSTTLGAHALKVPELNVHRWNFDRTIW